MDKKTLRRIIEEEKAQYKRNKKLLKEHKVFLSRIYLRTEWGTPLTLTQLMKAPGTS